MTGEKGAGPLWPLFPPLYNGMNCTLPTHHLLGWGVSHSCSSGAASGLESQGSVPCGIKFPSSFSPRAQVEGLAGAHLAVWGTEKCDGTWHMVVSMDNALQCSEPPTAPGWRLGLSCMGPQLGPVVGGNQ